MGFVMSKAGKNTNATTLSTNAPPNPHFDPSRFGTIEISPEFRARMLALELQPKQSAELPPMRWFRVRNLLAWLVIVLAAGALGCLIYWIS
jgi:hypothetical protein